MPMSSFLEIWKWLSYFQELSAYKPVWCSCLRVGIVYFFCVTIDVQFYLKNRTFTRTSSFSVAFSWSIAKYLNVIFSTIKRTYFNFQGGLNTVWFEVCAETLHILSSESWTAAAVWCTAGVIWESVVHSSIIIGLCEIAS